ncbi:cysteine-rich receptor-like protein kinase 8 [Tanacetum coccineum]
MTTTGDTTSSNSNQNGTINDINSANHPLYFHPQDHPGMILISRKLIGSENYSHWKRSTIIALSARNLKYHHQLGLTGKGQMTW